MGTAKYYKNFEFTDERYDIIHIRETYTKKPTNKTFSAKPDSVSQEYINCEIYTSFVRSIPHFNKYPDGAYCRGSESYTMAGLIPTTITTVNPGRTIKYIDRFDFEYR